MKKIKSILRLKKVWIPSLILGLALVLFLVWGSFHYSKKHLIEEYVSAYRQSGDTFENIKGYVVWSDTNQQVTNDQAQYTMFTKLSKSEAQKLSETLEKADSSDDSYIKKVGRRFLFFPAYRVALKPMSLTIKTNINQVDVLLNEKKVAVSDSEDYTLTLERLPIADYTASISGTYNGKPVELSKAYDGENSLLDLTVSFKTFKVTSNLTDGELYFDDTRIGTLSNGEYDVSDYPLTDSAQAYVKKNYSDGELTSQKQALSGISDGDTVALDAENLLDEASAGQILVSAFDQLISYLSTGQDSSTVSTVFEDGANNEFYKGLKESIKAKMQTDTRKASSLTVPAITLTSLSQIGKESYLVNFSATYDFYYDKSTDSEKNTSGDVIQTLEGKMTLKKSGSSYVVANSGQKNITVTGENNQVKSDSVFPEKILGTWKVDDKDDIIFKFEADGMITKTTKDNEVKTAKVTKLEEEGDNIYRYVYNDGTDTSAFITSGIGGIGVKYAFGIKIDGSHLKLVLWQTGTNDDFDYSKPLYGNTLTKK